MAAVVEEKGDSRRIYFTGDFNEESSKNAIITLLDLEAKNPLKDIIFYINSYGGYVDDFVAIHDTIKMLRCRVVTVCVGKAMSAGAFLLMSGTKGFRFITPNSRTMIHQLSASTWGKLTEMENHVDQLKSQQKQIRKLTLEYTKITEKNIDKILEKDSYFSADETIKFGIADKIIDSNTELYKKLKL